MNKYLRQCIGTLIEEHQKELALGADVLEVNALRTQYAETLDQFNARELEYITKAKCLEEKLKEFEANKVSPNVGPE